MESKVIISAEEYKELILSKLIVDDIFAGCEVYEWSQGKAEFRVNRDFLRKIYPKRFLKTVQDAENEYKIKEMLKSDV